MATIEIIKQCLCDSINEVEPSKRLETAISIIRALLKVQCCSRCCLRFMNAGDLKLYAVPEQELGSLFAQLTEEEYNVQVCTACVGSLQHAESFAEPIGKRLEDENYETRTLSLTVTLPISLLPREHLLRVYLRDTLGIKSITVARDAKEPFRHILNAQLKKDFDIRPSATSPLRMILTIENKETSKDHMFLTQVKEPVLRVRTQRKKGKILTIGDSRPTVTEALRALKDDEARSLTTVPPASSTTLSTVESMQLTHESAYVGGRYMKYSREYSQTPWSIKGKKLTEHSVSESICEILKQKYRCDEYKFVSSGREDANVRMLGTGRPFYCELVNPRKLRFDKSEYAAMQDEINSLPSKDAVQLRDLTAIDQADTKIIKEGEEFKRKTYRALVWVSSPVTDEMIEKVNAAGSNPFKIKQNTPVRVFQRRAGIVREKEIHYCTAARPSNIKEDAEEAEKHFVVVSLNTQAGTYIKEFVHGDLGRTQPNFTSLAGVEAADLIELDVTEVDLTWPPEKQ
ncbi:hypothetical protein BJV82DRAFT_563459 [Fennellomyces sp. T-0311]|nr:hypothetical protein BJV82DRAFT_563459 [Fennellomyces sp. T-0311]